jgi:hypothetical protein
MPETVGTAFVRVLVDGSEVPDGIRDAVGDDKDWQNAGRRTSKNFSKGFEDETERHPTLRALQLSLLRGAGR